MKSKSIFKFKNNFINEEGKEDCEEINENSYEETNSEDVITIRKLNIEEMAVSQDVHHDNPDEIDLIVSTSLDKQINALITISVEELPDYKKENDQDNIEPKICDANLNPPHQDEMPEEEDALNKTENYRVKTEYMADTEESPKVLQEKVNLNATNKQKEIATTKFLTEKGESKNSVSTRPSHRKNYSMMIKENTNQDEALDWRTKDRSMSQTVDLKENKCLLLNNIKFLYDSSTNRSKKRVQQMRNMQVSRGSISSCIDLDNPNEIAIVVFDNEIIDNQGDPTVNLKRIKPETTTLHIKNKTIDMNNPDLEFDVNREIINKNIIKNSNNENVIQTQENLKEPAEEDEETVSTKLSKYNLPCQMGGITSGSNLTKIDSERTLNGNLSTAPQLTTTPFLTNENVPVSTKVHTSCYNEDTEVVISDLEGSLDNKGDETNEDNLFSLSASYSHKSFIPITNSLKSKKDIKEENATPSYLLALSQCINGRSEDESVENTKFFPEISKSSYNLMSYENLDSLENVESLKSSQNRFSTDRNKNNFYKSMKEVKHIRLPSGKNYFINSVIEEEFSEICSDSELSFKKHSYLFTKGKLDASSDKKFSLQSSKEFQVEKNLENLFFNKMKNNHSNSKSEIPSEMNNNLKNAAELNLNQKKQKNDNTIDKNELFNIHIDLKKNFDELKKKISEEEERTKAKVENKKREIIDLFFNKTKNTKATDNIINTTTNRIQDKVENRNVNSTTQENSKKPLNKIVINLNTIDSNKISPKSPSPPIKGKKSPSSKCREEYYQDNSDRSKKHKKFEDMIDSLPKISKEDFDMKIYSPLKRQNIDQTDGSPIKINEVNFEKKSSNVTNINTNPTPPSHNHKTLKEIYKRQREQKSKHSSIFKSEDLRISKPDGITIHMSQIDSNRKFRDNNTNTFNSINEQFSFININNNINICTPLSLKNEIVEYGTATERATDKHNNNQFDFVKNNMSANNELCQASPISFLNHLSNRKSMNINLNFSAKQEIVPGENVQNENTQEVNLKRILFQNESDVNKSEQIDNKKYKDEMSVSNEITINIINKKKDAPQEKKDLKEIVDNVKIENKQHIEEEKGKALIKRENVKNITNDRKENTNNQDNKNNILKVSMCDILKRETLIQHKKNVSLNPKVFLNQEYKLNNLLMNNKANNSNENTKNKSNSIGKNLNSKVDSFNSINNTQTTTVKPQIIEKDNKLISTNLNNYPDLKLQTKNHAVTNMVKNKTRSSSDSSVKFNHINELLTKQHSNLQVPNPILINYNVGTKKLEKKLNLAALNSTLDKNKIATLNSSNNNRNLSHDIKSNSNISTNMVAGNKKSDLKKMLIGGNKNHSMNAHIYSTNNSNIESAYSSVGNKSTSGNSTKQTADKSKSLLNSHKAGPTVPIPKIPNIKKNTANYKTIQNVPSVNNYILNNEEMFKLYDKIKNMNIDKTGTTRNDSKSRKK